MTTTGRPSPTAALEALVLPRIDHVDLVTVRLPFVAPFGTSVHVWTVKEAMLMRIEAAGVTAWSECVSDPDPFYAYETNTTARHIIKDFLLPLFEPGSPWANWKALPPRSRPRHGQGDHRETRASS